MDFQGQKLAEQIFQLLLIIFGSLGAICGYIMQDFKISLGILGAGVGLACVICLPDWPCFNRHALKWLPPQEDSKKKLKTK